MTTEVARRSAWKTGNTWAGYVLFGLPAALAVPALATTLAHFGVWKTLSAAVPAALWACTPLFLWHRYTRRPPQRRLARLLWSVLAVVAVVMLLASPLWFWAGPSLLVLTSEALRLLLGRSLSRASAAIRGRLRPFTAQDRPRPQRSAIPAVPARRYVRRTG